MERLVRMKPLRDKIADIIWTATENYEMGAEPSCGLVADAIIACIEKHNKESLEMKIGIKAKRRLNTDDFEPIVRKILNRSIYITPHGYVPLDEALLIMTDSWIADGNITHQTAIDLRDAIKVAINQA